MINFRLDFHGWKSISYHWLAIELWVPLLWTSRSTVWGLNHDEMRRVSARDLWKDWKMTKILRGTSKDCDKNHLYARVGQGLDEPKSSLFWEFMLIIHCYFKHQCIQVGYILTTISSLTIPKLRWPFMGNTFAKCLVPPSFWVSFAWDVILIVHNGCGPIWFPIHVFPCVCKGNVKWMSFWMPNNIFNRCARMMFHP